MLNISNFSPSDQHNVEQSIRINRNTKHVNLKGVVVRFQDKDTKQFILYIPALEISAYGETKEKAEQMFKIALDDFFAYLTALSRNAQEAELRKLGFKQKKLNNKVYSKSYIDSDGILQSVNAMEGKVEILSLVA